MFVASRRSSVIQVYDTRDPSAPFAELPRDGQTNQRLTFDVDPWGRYLAAGDRNGKVKVWDCRDLSSKEPVFDHQLHQGTFSRLWGGYLG